MKVKPIYIIIIIVIILCLSSLSALYFYKKKQGEKLDIENFNKNINDYNSKYNQNYFESALYKSSDLNSMLKASATIISEPQTKEITVNDKVIKLYSATINYKAINHNKKDVPPIKLVNTDDPFDINSGAIQFKKENPLPGKEIDVTTNIVTTQPIQKNQQIEVFYSYGISARFAPPFLPEKYVTFLSKK